jgi:hypothetical protein
MVDPFPKLASKQGPGFVLLSGLARLPQYIHLKMKNGSATTSAVFDRGWLGAGHAKKIDSILTLRYG